jgi:hypothetical protein
MRGRYRFCLPIKSPRNFDLLHFIRGWIANAPKTRGSLKLEVDIDPQIFSDASNRLPRARRPRLRPLPFEGEGCAKGSASRGG